MALPALAGIPFLVKALIFVILYILKTLATLFGGKALWNKYIKHWRWVKAVQNWRIPEWLHWLKYLKYLDPTTWFKGKKK